MATLEEHRDVMTLFYSISTGRIKCYCTGIQTLDYFGEEKDDFNYDFIVTDYDEFVLRNTGDFMVVDNELVYIQPVTTYKAISRTSCN